VRTSSQRQERNIAKRYGGTTNAGSGNGWVRKNDVRTEDESIECKITTKGSYTLKVSELIQAEQHAILDDRVMLFIIEFASNNRRYVILDETDYLELRNGAQAEVSSPRELGEGEMLLGKGDWGI
jgi:hypothetical protein